MTAMNETREQVAFTSSVGFDQKRIHAAAIYCSDGRFGEAFDEFLMKGLGLPKVDRVALPGGPAALAGYSQARLAESGVVDEVKFLVEAHELDRVILIQHGGCAFYKARLEVRDESLEQLQKADLARAAYTVRHAINVTNIEGYFARPDPDGIMFEKVELF